MDPRLEKSVKSLFRGLVAGDGDVYSRMASSHEGATAPYPEPLAGIRMKLKMNEAQKAVLPIIESVYTDGVDAIGEPSLSDDERFIIVQFQDGEKLLEAKISDTDIEIKMLNPEDEENRNLEDERQKKNALPVNPAEILV